MAEESMDRPPKIQEQMEIIQYLPKGQEPFVMQMIDTILA